MEVYQNIHRHCGHIDSSIENKSVFFIAESGPG